MGYITVVGGVNMDIGAVSAAPLIAADSNPGRVRTSFGGVGRNIAHNLRLLGMEVSLVTVFGEDAFGHSLRAHATGLGMDLRGSAVYADAATSTYLYIADNHGEMALAVNDMEIYQRMTPEFLSQRLPLINGAALCVVDANLPEESLFFLAERCAVPLLADPVSTVKAERLRRALPRLWALKPNRIEAAQLSGVPIESEADLPRAAEALLKTGLQRVYISLSADGMFAADRGGETVRLPGERAAEIVNTTGCGDAMVAALAAARVRGLGMEASMAAALRAAKIAALSNETISPAMRWEAIESTGGQS